MLENKPCIELDGNSGERTIIWPGPDGKTIVVPRPVLPEYLLSGNMGSSMVWKMCLLEGGVVSVLPGHDVLSTPSAVQIEYFTEGRGAFYSCVVTCRKSGYNDTVFTRNTFGSSFLESYNILQRPNGKTKVFLIRGGKKIPLKTQEEPGSKPAIKQVPEGRPDLSGNEPILHFFRTNPGSDKSKNKQGNKRGRFRNAGRATISRTFDDSYSAGVVGESTYIAWIPGRGVIVYGEARNTGGVHLKKGVPHVDGREYLGSALRKKVVFLCAKGVQRHVDKSIYERLTPEELKQVVKDINAASQYRRPESIAGYSMRCICGQYRFVPNDDPDDQATSSRPGTHDADNGREFQLGGFTIR